MQIIFFFCIEAGCIINFTCFICELREYKISVLVSTATFFVHSCSFFLVNVMQYFEYELQLVIHKFIKLTTTENKQILICLIWKSTSYNFKLNAGKRYSISHLKFALRHPLGAIKHSITVVETLGAPS